jgi:hypothetical protein
MTEMEKIKLIMDNDTGETPKAAMQEQLPIRVNFFFFFCLNKSDNFGR